MLVYRRRRRQHAKGAALFRGGSDFFFRSKPIFQVRVARKLDGTPTTHPWSRTGCEFGYEIRQASEPWAAGRKLQLVRGHKYSFRLSDVNRDFPFYISFSEIGGGNGMQEYLQGVQGSPAIANDTLIFTVPYDCPPLLYYQCTRQKSMGGAIYIVDDAEPLEEVTVDDSESMVSEHEYVPEPTPAPTIIPPPAVASAQPRILPAVPPPNPTYFAPPLYVATGNHSSRANVEPASLPTYYTPPVYDTAVSGRGPYRPVAVDDSEERKKSD